MNAATLNRGAATRVYEAAAQKALDKLTRGEFTKAEYIERIEHLRKINNLA